MAIVFRDSDGTARLYGDLLAPGGATGDVLTQQADGTYAPAAGGSQPGVAIVRGPFAFAHNTAGLATGVSVYSPAINDVVLTAWVEVTTAFNGTTPLLDFGAGAVGGDGGIFGQIAGAGWDLTAPAIVYGSMVQAGLSPASTITAGLAVRMTAADAVQLWVTQDGLKTGAASGATAGAGNLYIVTATPVAFA